MRLGVESNGPAAPSPVSLPTAPRAVSAIPLAGSIPGPQQSQGGHAAGCGIERSGCAVPGLAPDSPPGCLRDPTRWFDPRTSTKPGGPCGWVWNRTVRLRRPRSRSRQPPGLSPRSHSLVRSQDLNKARGAMRLGVESNGPAAPSPVSLRTAPRAVSAIPLAGSIPGPQQSQGGHAAGCGIERSGCAVPGLAPDSPPGCLRDPTRWFDPRTSTKPGGPCGPPGFVGAPDWNRTSDLWLRRPAHHDLRSLISTN